LKGLRQPRPIDLCWKIAVGASRQAPRWCGGLVSPARHLPAVSPEEDADRHGPVLRQLLEIIRRGQESGDFDRGQPPSWLLAAGLALGRAAEEEVKARRMTIDEATGAVHHSFLRLFGVRDPGPR
jgi:hypothetical protein